MDFCVEEISCDEDSTRSTFDMRDIPIHKDSRSFEEQRRDFLEESEMSHMHSSSTWKDSDEWCEELSQKMEERRRKLDEEIHKRRDEFFKLKPMDSRFGGFCKSEHSNLDNFSFKQMPTAYERASDNKLHFRVRFDVERFAKEDLKISIEDSKLTITARHETKKGNTTSSREFSRSIDIPLNVDNSKLKCTLSEDGILLVDAPMRQKRYSPTSNDKTFDTDNTSYKRSFNSSTKKAYTSNSHFNSTSSLHQDSSYPIITKNDGDRWLHFEVDLGPEYNSDEIRIRTIDQKIIINAHHVEKSSSRSSFKEYSKEYDIPSDVDPNTVTAKLTNGILIVEAPVKKKHR